MLIGTNVSGFSADTLPDSDTQTTQVEPHTLRASNNDPRSAALRFGSISAQMTRTPWPG
jgi:hypothetical protein